MKISGTGAYRTFSITCIELFLFLFLLLLIFIFGIFSWKTTKFIHVSTFLNKEVFSFFFFSGYKFISFWLHWVFIAARGLSLVEVSRGYYSL